MIWQELSISNVLSQVSRSIINRAMNIQDTFCARREQMLNCLFCNRVVSSTGTALIVYFISLLPPTFNILNANRISAYTYCVVYHHHFTSYNCNFPILICELMQWLCSLTAQLGWYAHKSRLTASSSLSSVCVDLPSKEHDENTACEASSHTLNPDVWVHRFLHLFLTTHFSTMNVFQVLALWLLHFYTLWILCFYLKVKNVFDSTAIIWFYRGSCGMFY